MLDLTCCLCGGKAEGYITFIPDPQEGYKNDRYVYCLCECCRTTENMEKMEDYFFASEDGNGKQDA